ncbi:type VII secretion-associated serine protease mycosin [Streptomyces sp. NPDC058391]|uniref:type VII secretion-associated serine protease mycosin n=1 Tax=Streptomyces sp. NPDC058391 TaxID=3346476 RepID=UPI003667CDA9
MHINCGRSAGFRCAVSTGLGLMLLGVAATPAHAETVRDQQWHLDAMKADEIWKISTGRGITVAVIDSGVDDSVPDLRGQVLEGEDLSGLSGDENNDVDNHGTAMAALIAATGKRGPTQGSYGLAPGSKILPIRFPYAEERWGAKGAKESFAESMSKAIRFAADSDAKVINISVGNDEGGAPELTEAVKYALDKDKLIFSSVGNDGAKGNQIQYPAATPGVVGVGALDRNAARTSVSQWGPQVDLSAPGEDITNACSGGTQLCEGTGTSPATALASASAALIWSKHPDWTNNQVLRVMLNTASGVKGGAKRSDQVGYGAVRPLLALTAPGDPGPADEYPLPDLAAAAPKPSAPEASKAPGGTDGDQQSEPPAAAAASDDGGNTGLWIGLGIGAALVIGAAVAVPIVRSRRRAAVPPQPQPPAPGFAPYQQQPYQPQPYQPQQQNTPYPPYTPPQPGQGQHAPHADPRGPGYPR